MKTSLSKFKRVPLATLRGVLRSCAIHKGASTDAIARSCDIGESTVSKALVVLLEVGLVEGDSSGWLCGSTVLGRTSGDVAVDAIIRDAVLAYRPFESICEGLLAGEDFDQAVRHTAVAFSLDRHAEVSLRLFLQWGVELGVLTGGDAVELSADLTAGVKSLAAMPVAAVSSAAETRLYISTLLGRDAFDELDEVDRGLLTTTVSECDCNPAASVEASGQALEDYLRELSGSKGHAGEACKLNGAGQLGGLLRQHDLIHPHHVKLIDSISMLRNAKAHKKDKQTVTPWNITSLGARTAFGTTALAIKSIHDWVSDGRQTL
jgi:hypothetical protein